MDDVMEWSETHLANELNKAGKHGLTSAFLSVCLSVSPDAA